MLLVPIILIPFGSRAQSCSASKASLTTLIESSREILKQSHITAATANMPEYCQRNFLLRFINSQKKAPPDCETKSIEELEKIASDLMFAVAKVDSAQDHAWNFGLVPTEVTAKHAVNFSLKEIGYGQNSEIPPLVRMRKYLESGTQLSTNEKDRIRKSISDMKDSKNPEADERMTSMKSMLFCAEISVLKAVQCNSGLEILFQKMNPKAHAGRTKFSDLDLWSEVLLNEKYDEGLRRAGLKILDRVDGKMSDSDNVYDDVLNSFKESGMGQTEAHRATLKVMGVVSNGAQNTSNRLAQLGYARTMLDNKSNALTILAGSLQLLDFKKSKAGQPAYSLPPNVKSKCMNMKPYHFWMAAYLSESLVTENNFNPDTAAIATYSGQKAYQLNRDYGRPGDGVGKVSSVLAGQPFGPVHQVVRMDLAFSAAGAQWGGRSGLMSQKSFDIDSALIAMMRESEVRTPPAAEELQGQSMERTYLTWRSVFAPNAAFESLSK